MKRKEEILREVAALFFEKGYSGTSIRDIGKALNLTNPGIYYYFETKQQILATICTDLMDKTLDEVRAKLDAMTDPKEMLSCMVASHVNTFAENPAETKVMIYEQHCLEGEYADEFRQLQREYLTILKDILSRLFKIFGTDLDINVAAFSFIGMLNWVVQWYKPGGKVPPANLINDMTRLFLRGLEGSHE